MQAQKSLSSISANRDLWIAQYRQEMADRDKRSSISAAIKKGMAQGMAQGLAQGIMQGKKEGKYEDAKNFLKLGISPQQVAAGTGLSIAEVETLLEIKD